MNPFSSSLSTSSSSKRKRDENSVDEPICRSPKYGLFVNYLYEDIGKSFISHVHGALDRNGFTISDHTKVPVGQEICSELLKSIEESEICVLVFSPKYASSVRCLNELAHIMDWGDEFDNKKVFPVFFKIDPRDVRKQQGPFKEAFEAHTANFDHQIVQKWRKALNDACQLSGEHYMNGDEESFICKIVKKLQSMHNPEELYVTDHPVGVESRVKELLSRLRLDLEDVSIVAVLGIGGIGKTTIVKALYNRIVAEFDASCFLEVNSSMVEMQKLLIFSLLKKSQYDNLPMIHHHSQGITMIRRLARGRKLLLVLDNVTHVIQLEAFGINSFKTSFLNTCFGGGSRIIVTTRDKRSLGNLSYVSYNTPLLNMEESIELFTQLMDDKDEPIDMEFLEELEHCAAGLPLVLDVWSRHIRHHEREQWPNVLKTLKAIPHDDVQKKLKISYDSLTNRAKKLFLDIACFFVGMDKELVIKVLQDEKSAFFPDQEIHCLADRGLVNISFEYGPTTVAERGLLTFYSEYDPKILSMHDTIREMGQEIVRQENEDEPGQRTRLMKHEDVRCVLNEFSGTQSVESIWQGTMTVDIEAFRKMNNLRLIRLHEVTLGSVPSQILGCDSEGMPPLSFCKLKYLEWQGFPMKSINIDMCNVVVVKLQYSGLETLWKGSKHMEKLKILDVSHSRFLSKTGSFIGLKNLESLHFKGCKKLEELDSSICYLDKLVRLDLHGCNQLKRFPSETILKFRSLEVLDLTHCVGIGFEHDEVITHFMSSLKETHITRLTLNNCKIYNVPSEVGSLTWLNHLDLGGNSFHSLPDSLGQLHLLEIINLSHCYRLRSIPDLPQSVCSLKASYCDSLTTLPSNMSELTSLRNLGLQECKCLATLPSGMSGLTSLKELDLNGCSKLGTEDLEYLMKITGLPSLTVLKMGHCNVSQIHSEIGNLVLLQRLNLSGNPFSSLPDSFRNLLQLRDLSICDCSELTSLKLLPPLLTMIEAPGCLSLDVMRPASMVIDNIYGCPTPSRNRDHHFYEFSECVLSAYKEASFKSRLRINLSEGDVPIWCHYIGRREGESFMAPQHLDRKICGMILCVSARDSFDHLVAKLQNQTKGTTYRLTTEWVLDMMCVMFVPLDNTTLMVEAGDEFAVNIQSNDGKYFSGYGLCLIYKGEGDEMEPMINRVN